MHPRKLSIADFTYTLPAERIANYPLAERDLSKLLIYRDNTISTDIYKNISQHIPTGSLLVFNDTKVVEARLLFQKTSGGFIELFCLEPDPGYGSIAMALQQQGDVHWQCLVGGASKWKHGQVLEKVIDHGNESITLQATYTEKSTGSFRIHFKWTPASMNFAEVLHHAGAIPLPPYIKRKAEPSDAERYQTIYAHFEGSVAAPTAGLHFTEHVFAEMQHKSISKEFVTLHVGAGTFKPVKSATMDQHEMHSEFIDVSRTTIENLIAHLANPIIAVGTTSLRTLESLYWLGIKCIDGKSLVSNITQWEPYDNPHQAISAKDSLEAILGVLRRTNQDSVIAKTQIILAPGYRPRIVKGLITNFHQPQSTLLLLVASLIGEKWREAYDYALAHDFRFLSYGDGSLLWM